MVFHYRKAPSQAWRAPTVQDTASSELTGDDASVATASERSASSQNIWSSITERHRRRRGAVRHELLAVTKQRRPSHDKATTHDSRQRKRDVARKRDRKRAINTNVASPTSTPTVRSEPCRKRAVTLDDQPEHIAFHYRQTTSQVRQ
jgi:hypothetical protein